MAPSKTPARPIIIAGAGLGGVAAGLALAQRGFHVKILEAAAELGVIGYGIQLGPNVFAMLRDLGIEKAVLACAHVPPDVRMVDAYTGEDVLRLETGSAFRDRFGAPYVVIHRVDLHRCLLEACSKESNVEILAASEITGFETLEEGVRVNTSDGRSFDGSALVGADGLGSLVRSKLIREEAPKPVGYVAHRTIVPWSEAPKGAQRDEVILWGGNGFHIVQYPLRDKSLFNIVVVFRTQNLHERADPESYRRILMETYADAHPVMLEMLAMMDVTRRWVIADRDPISQWSFGAVTLLGDAAHPTLQSYAQGACMAIEDAIILADCAVQAKGDFTSAFKRYEKQRRLRTARIVLESRSLWRFYHLGGIAAEVRNEECATRTQEDLHRCVQWIYDGAQRPDAAK